MDMVIELQGTVRETIREAIRGMVREAIHGMVRGVIRETESII